MMYSIPVADRSLKLESLSAAASVKLIKRKKLTYYKLIRFGEQWNKLQQTGFRKFRTLFVIWN